MAKYICEISASGWFYYKYICHDARSHVTMHGHTNVNYCDISQFAISNETCSVQWRSAAWPKPQNNSTVDKDSCDADEVHWYRVGEQTDRDPTFGQNSPSSQRSILTAAHPHSGPSSQRPIPTACSTTHTDISDLVMELNLSENQAETLASGWKGCNLRQHDTNTVFPQPPERTETFLCPGR